MSNLFARWQRCTDTNLWCANGALKNRRVVTVRPVFAWHSGRRKRKHYHRQGADPTKYQRRVIPSDTGAV